MNPSQIFQFRPHIQDGLLSGKYIQTFSNGIPIGEVHDAVTGQYVEGGKAIAASFSPEWNPASGLQILGGNASSMQSSIKALSQSVGVLQASTAFIGVGVAATAAISAVNLWQTMKLRDDVKKLRLEVKDGFINLQQALQDQGAEVLAHIAQVADDVEFRAHRLILSRAYQRFIQGTERLQLALGIEDAALRQQEISAARDFMFEARADYTNPDILSSEVSAPGYLRRRECVWAIEQAIAFTYQLQQEYTPANQRLSQLSQQIELDAKEVVNRIQSEAELDFVFPELKRIWNQDRLALKIQQAQNEEMLSLPTGDRQQLLMSNELTPIVTDETVQLSQQPIAEPIELQQYREQREVSHFDALRDSLKLMIEPSEKLKYSEAIWQSAKENDLKALTVENLSQVSDIAIANLYHYLCDSKPSQQAA